MKQLPRNPIPPTVDRIKPRTIFAVSPARRKDVDRMGLYLYGSSNAMMNRFYLSD